MSYTQEQQVTVLKNKGYKENVHFRIVWFGTQAEIKLVK